MHYYLADDTVELLENLPRTAIRYVLRVFYSSGAGFGEVFAAFRMDFRAFRAGNGPFWGARNSGCAPYPTFWRRSPLRKNPYISATPGMLEPAAEVYKPEAGGADLFFKGFFEVFPGFSCFFLRCSAVFDGFFMVF